MTVWRDKEKGTYAGATTYCPANAYGDCPYCDQMNICHIDDPMADCDDFAAYFENWDDWLARDEYNEIPDDSDECGFDPFEGGYTYDC